jgi:3-methyladenine DNA glycosylase AlkD
MINKFKKEMQKLKNPEKARKLAGYFKTGEGEYADGDVFLGIIVPEQRKVAKKYDLSLDEMQKLLSSNIHEYRLTALFILVDKYKKADEKLKKEIVDFYLKNTKNINNWDLVDLSAPNILGDFLLNKNRKVLYKLAKGHLWEKRIAILATFAFIRKNDFSDSLRIAEILLKDKHDLIHKAVGWMLREIGKRDLKAEEKFLKKHYRHMPRTMLRYAIEKFPEKKREFYLCKKLEKI